MPDTIFIFLIKVKTPLGLQICSVLCYKTVGCLGRDIDGGFAFRIQQRQSLASITTPGQDLKLASYFHSLA